MCVFFLSYNKCDKDQGFSSGAVVFFPRQCLGKLSFPQSVQGEQLCSLQAAFGPAHLSLEEMSRKPSSHTLRVSPAEAFGQHYRCPVLVTSAFRAWKTRANETGRFFAKLCVFANTVHSIFPPGIYLWRESPIFQCW